MFLYACIQVLVEAQTFTSGNVSEANQNVVSKVQQVILDTTLVHYAPIHCIRLWFCTRLRLEQNHKLVQFTTVALEGQFTVGFWRFNRHFDNWESPL